MSPNQQDSAQDDTIRRLCPECGLCCNGVLFADVHLVQGDNALTLENVGLTLNHCDGELGFNQPCSCFDGQFCTAYEQRPIRCRRFNCHTLKQVNDGEITTTDALERIREAKQETAEVRNLLSALGQTDEHWPLTKRYRYAMMQPVDLSAGEEQVAQQGELMNAMSNLMDRLQRDFLE